jgi:torulene dioxygenase
VFVAAPDAVAEDDGVILTVALDARTGTSALVVLDAASFTETGRAVLPQHVPFGFHGHFYGDLT